MAAEIILRASGDLPQTGTSVRKPRAFHEVLEKSGFQHFMSHLCWQNPPFEDRFIQSPLMAQA